MVAVAGLLLLCSIASASATAPFWGAKQSRSVDTPLGELGPGDWIWGGDDKAMGPMVAVASIDEQRLYVYRNGVLVAVSTISTGKPGHETPTGVFTILEKDKDHHSRKYNNAPMPYEERLTWDGIAIHAGGLPGYPESHGCLHLPTEFARLLFESTDMGMTVVIARQGAVPMALVHPGVVSPVDPRSGKHPDMPSLADGREYRWTPELAEEGPISLVLSRSDRQLVVLRGGVEIGRSRLALGGPPRSSGTHVYVMSPAYMDGTFPRFPGGKAPQWHAYPVPGHESEGGEVLDAATIDSVSLPPAFVDHVYPLLRPGTILVATDAPILPATTGGQKVRVVDAEPPGGP
ncbi:L,D-transpeptidase [Pseudoxanthomonas putridarboris]|uniref:L,D-transpeptidase n=1 Tax=Pseudoxanthomonas putridarboris TaxID=752605 RepID=A0ABU9J5H8_9GAMM